MAPTVTVNDFDAGDSFPFGYRAFDGVFIVGNQCQLEHPWLVVRVVESSDSVVDGLVKATAAGGIEGVKAHDLMTAFVCVNRK